MIREQKNDDTSAVPDQIESGNTEPLPRPTRQGLSAALTIHTVRCQVLIGMA